MQSLPGRVQSGRLAAWQHALRPLVKPVASSAVAASTPVKPSPAETARTVVDICRQGTLCTLAADGTPIGTPVHFTLDKAGHPSVEVGALEMQNLNINQRCSLQVQPSTYPARAVASVTLVGRMQLPESNGQQGSHTLCLEVDKCLYFGGLDQSMAATVVPGEEFRAAEPDVLRSEAGELISIWNDERAEDIYRITSAHLNIPLAEMSYAELLWLDQLGMYVSAESEQHLPQPTVVRVPFYRAVLDERDARSVLTMAAQVSWEHERPYTPPVPEIFTDAVGISQI